MQIIYSFSSFFRSGANKGEISKFVYVMEKEYHYVVVCIQISWKLEKNTWIAVVTVANFHSGLFF